MNNEACIETEDNELKKMICSFSVREKIYVADIVSLKEQIRSLQVKLFGRSSEAKMTPDDKQINLFDFPEDELLLTDNSDDDEIEVPGHTRKKPGRKPIPKDLPRIDVEHDLTDEEKNANADVLKPGLVKKYQSNLISSLQKYR